VSSLEGTIMYRVIFTRTLPLCSVLLIQKSAPIVVAKSHLKLQFSPKKTNHVAIAEFIKRQTMEAFNEKKLRSYQETLRRRRKKLEKAILDKRTRTRTKTSFSPENKEPARKRPSSKEEIDFWQVRTRAWTTDACRLCSRHQWAPTLRARRAVSS